MSHLEPLRERALRTAEVGTAFACHPLGKSRAAAGGLRSNACLRLAAEGTGGRAYVL